MLFRPGTGHGYKNRAWIYSRSTLVSSTIPPLRSVDAAGRTTVFKRFHAAGTNDRCFLAAWVISKSVIAVKHDRPKPYLPKRLPKRVYPNIQQKYANRKKFFLGQSKV